jgi:hypothetical protein
MRGRVETLAVRKYTTRFEKKQDFVKHSKPPNAKSEFITPGTSERNKRQDECRSLAKPPMPATPLDSRNHVDRSERSHTFAEAKRLYLRVGDEVTHLRYDEWGIGVVMECMTSSVPGGTCLARIRFQDGQLRCFNNDLDNESCCYYFGVRRYWNPSHGVNAIRSKFFLRG